jgi:hypothetical protein
MNRYAYQMLLKSFDVSYMLRAIELGMQLCDESNVLFVQRNFWNVRGRTCLCNRVEYIQVQSDKATSNLPGTAGQSTWPSCTTHREYERVVMRTFFQEMLLQVSLGHHPFSLVVRQCAKLLQKQAFTLFWHKFGQVTQHQALYTGSNPVVVSFCGRISCDQSGSSGLHVCAKTGCDDDDGDDDDDAETNFTPGFVRETSSIWILNPLAPIMPVLLRMSATCPHGSVCVCFPRYRVLSHVLQQYLACFRTRVGQIFACSNRSKPRMNQESMQQDPGLCLPHEKKGSHASKDHK